MLMNKGYQLLVKPTHRCNMSCKYCYDKPNRARVGDKIMSLETLEDIVSKLTPSAGINWTWHGGECTTVPIDFYYKAQELFGKYGNTYVTQVMQSNGYQVSDEFIQMLIDCNISIGVSFDLGAQDTRKSGTSSRVADTIVRLADRGLRVGCITVITEQNIDRIIEMYKEVRDYWHYTPSFNIIYSTAGSEEFGLNLDPVHFSRKIKEFVHYVLHDPNPNAVSERTVMDTISCLSGQRVNICMKSDCRGQYICVDPNGNLYPCDRVYPDYYCSGNIKDLTVLSDYFLTPQYALWSMRTEERLRRFCYQCKYYPMCGGGCYTTQMTDTQDDPSKVSTQTCNSTQDLLKICYAEIREIDQYSEQINQKFADYLLEENVFWPKEMRMFFEEMGISIPQPSLLEDFPDTLEFKVLNALHGNEMQRKFEPVASLERQKAILTYMTPFDWGVIRSRRKHNFLQRVKSAAPDLSLLLKEDIHDRIKS